MMKQYLLLTLIYLIVSPLSAQTFTETDNAATEKFTGSRAATFVDLNEDGWLDIFITNGKKDGENNLLYINDGEGGFKENTSSLITKDNSPADGATWGDFDNDGAIDLYVVTWYGEKNFFYHNRGGEMMSNSGIQSSEYSETASWADYNQDGYLDLFITNSSLGNGAANEFYINDGDGTFTSGKESGVTTTSFNSRGVNWIDYDNDNDLDLFVSNESAPNELYINEDGEFTKLTSGDIVTVTTNSTGSSWADYDNDGDLDLFVSNAGQTNELYNNQGDGTFIKITGEGMVTGSDNSYGAAWGDIDNDGDLDLYIANGFKTGERIANRLFLNDGDGTFTEDTDSETVATIGWSFGAAFGDYDNDGFLDLMVANTFDEAQSNGLYHNDGNDNNWLILDLEGTSSNRSAIGAKVKVTATIGGVEVKQLREISSQSGYNCQNSMRAHFGLGDATAVTEVEIIWPNGNAETLEDVSINEIVSVKETVPEDFLRADFALEDPVYVNNTTIQFNDLTVYSEDQSVSYEWDFDNDGEVDSTDPSPTASFTENGDYTVKLVVKSGGKSSKKIKKDYLKIRSTILSVADAQLTPTTRVYPNPVNDRINIKADYNISAYQIHAIDGQSIVNRKVGANGLSSIDLKNMDLKAGIYTLVLSGKGKREFIKILIKD